MFDIEAQEQLMDGMLIDPAIVINGKDGKDGKDGEQGVPGLDGLPGKDGKDGKDGRDGVDGKDGKDGVSSWIEYDKKTNTLIFKNDGGLKNPDPIKLPAEAKGWGFGAGASRGGGGQVQADWNQTDKNNPTYIKNKPAIHNIRFLIVDELPTVGDFWTIYLVAESPTPGPRSGTGSDVYSEWIFVYNESTQTYSWEKLGTEVDLSGYQTKTAIVELEDDQTIVLADNTIYNAGTLTALTVSFPAASANTYTTEIDFTSGATATTFTYPADLKWIEGDDVSSQVFTPAANKRYICMVIYDGTQFVGTVRGVE